MSSLLEVCISNAIVATTLAIVAAAVSMIYRRPALTHTLWLLVLLKLITPPIVRIPVVWQTDAASADPTPIRLDENELVVKPQVDEDAFERQAPREIAQANPVADEPSADIDRAASDIAPSTSLDASPEATASSLNWDWLLSARTIVWIWLAGSACWFAAALARIVQFHLLLRHGKPASITLQQQGASIAGRLEMRRCPELWIMPGRVSPLLWALGARTRLVLPQDLLESLAPEQQATLLAHELAHARRRDHWVRWVEFIALGLYWWHPVAWIAKRQIRQAEEQCCDAWVVWVLPGRARAYAEALLETVGFLSGVRCAVPPVASGIGHAQLLRRRLTMILRESLCPRVSWRAHLGAILLGLGVLPLAPYHLTANATELDVSSDDSPAPQSDRETPDLERRLDALERKLDRVINAFEASRETRQADKPATSAAGKKSQESDEATPTKVEKAKRKATAKKTEAASKSDAIQKAKEAKAAAMQGAEQARTEAEAARKVAEEAKKKYPVDLDAQNVAQKTAEAKKKAEAARKAEKDADDAEMEKIDPEELAAIARQIAESVRESFDPEQMAELGRQIGEAIGNGIDPEQMAELSRQIGEAVSKSFDPEQMEDLGRRIEEAVNESFSPERMKELEEQIEELVAKAFDPQRLEEMERAIEEAASKGFDSERMKDVEQKIEKAVSKAKEAASKQDAEKPKAGAKSDGAKPDPRKATKRPPALDRDDSTRSDGAGRDTRQLERRMKTLEEKMDRLLDAIESKTAPSKP